MAVTLRWNKKNELLLGVWVVARVQRGICKFRAIVDAYGRWPIEDMEFKTAKNARTAVEPVVLDLLRVAGIKAEVVNAR